MKSGCRRFVRHTRWIGARVAELRSEQGISQQALAKMLGIGSQQMWKYEVGLDRLSFEAVVEIADILDAALEEFRPPQEALDDERRRRRDPMIAAL